MEEITIPQAPTGDTRDDCNACSGSGTCDMCQGSGYRFSHYDQNGEPVFDEEQDCLHCYEKKRGKCGYCLGVGKFDPALYNASRSEDRLNEIRNARSSREQYDYSIE